MAFGINPLTGRPGPAPKPGRDGDRKQARARVNHRVQRGELPHPNALPCVDCGHVWKKGERRHEYDHHKGYAAEHHYDVVSVCTVCHAKRDGKSNRTHCNHGHEFTSENTGHDLRGHRFCKTCRAAQNRKKRVRPPGYWKRINAKRRAA